MSLALFALYVTGGVLTLVSLALPHPDSVNEVGGLVCGSLAILSGVFIFARGDRLPMWTYGAFVAGGSGLISIGIHFGGYAPGTPSYALFYLWIGLFSFNFFTFRHALTQMTFSSLCHLVVLTIDGSGTFFLTDWVVTWGVLFVTGLTVGWLSGQVRTLADTDSLTGLRNRRAWDHELERELANAQRSGNPLSVIIIDIDGLKAVNDREGHQSGDRMLKEAAAAFSGAVRSGDLVVRLGGDEFGVLLRSCSADGARASIERMQKATSTPFCAGSAQWDGEESSDEFLHRADAALYERKVARVGGATSPLRAGA
jgi:diguanylate cyclase (GGDEF)-like protein